MVATGLRRAEWNEGSYSYRKKGKSFPKAAFAGREQIRAAMPLGHRGP